MTEKDPYMLTPEDGAAFQEKLKGKSQGVLCPKWNEKKPCAMCTFVEGLFRTKKEEDKKEAMERMAKAQIYVCGVLKKDPKKMYLIQMGKIVGSEIIEGVTNPEIGWTDIMHPKAGLGRCIKISKSFNGQHNVYKASADLNKADWDIDDSVLESLPDLADVVNVVESGDYEILNVATLEKGETLTFRICPDVRVKSRENGKPVWINAIFRHWGATQEEIDGTSPIRRRNVELQEENKKEQAQPAWSPNQDIDKAMGNPDRKKMCFGRSEFYNIKSPECIECKEQAECRTTIIG